MISGQILTILSFLAGALAVFGVYSLLSDVYFRDRSRVSRRINEEFRQPQLNQIQNSGLFKKKFDTFAGETDEDANSLRQRFRYMVEQSGLSLTPGRLLFFMAMAGLVCGTLAGLLRHSILVGVAGGLAGAVMPFIYVRSKRNARVEKMTRQLPDAFDLMGRVIRVSQSMPQALQAVADEFDDPIAGEFALCYEQQNLGLPPEVTLRNLAHRIGLLEVKIFVMAMLVQQQTGGNLAEMLDKLSHVVRERLRVRGKIRMLTSEGRAQASLLLVLPIALMLILMAISPTYAAALAKVPYLIVAMLVAEVIGALWIRKIVNFDF